MHNLKMSEVEHALAGYDFSRGQKATIKPYRRWGISPQVTPLGRSWNENRVVGACK